MIMKIDADIDVDMQNREQLLEVIRHVPAAMRNVSPVRKHSSGIYGMDIPYDPINQMATMDYTTAEKRGYFKLDLLNVFVYSLIKSEEHLLEMMQREPDWDRLRVRSFVIQLIHLSNHYDSIMRQPEPIDSIPRLAMFLSAIRPAKRHLLGQTWKEINEEVWEKGDGYTFRKSHAIAYAHLVVLHMNLISTSV